MIKQKNMFILKLYITKIIGAIFCHVRSINRFVHLKPSATSKYQKWKGAAPIFIKIAELKIKYDKEFNCSNELMEIREYINENKINIEAVTWTRKYFIDASEEYL